MRNLKRIICLSALAVVTLYTDANAAGASEIKEETNVCACKNDNENKIQFIKKLYSEYVFGGSDFSPIARKYCTRKLRQKLSEAYEYDCYDGECYAVWLFRSDVQDGTSDVCEVTRVTEQKDGWFLVNFIDMGIGGSVRIKFTDLDGTFMMDDIENQHYM